MNEKQMARRSRPPRIFAVLLALFGLVLGAGGIMLAAIGGSLYYGVAGVLLLAGAWLCWTGRPSAVAVLSAAIAGTVGWAFWESGFDYWALLPRIWPFALIALWLIMPSTLRRLRVTRPGRVRAGGVAAVLIALAVGGALHGPTGMAVPDPAYARGTTVAAQPAALDATPDNGDWTHYGNDLGGSRFSPLAEITAANVGSLKQAWTFRVGFGKDELKGNLEVTPIKVGNRMVLCTPYDDVIALDPVTGEQLWRYSPGTDRKGFIYNNCRGVAYYAVPGRTGPCAERIYRTTFDGMLFALDAATGRLCQDFGTGGNVSLLKGMGTFDRGYYFVSSPIAVIRGKLVMGGWVADGQYYGEPSGVIRAFDAVTGAFSWAFDMGRPDQTGEPGPGETYTHSTPNSWGPISADEELGLVYLPTGNPQPDYYGGLRRPFDEKYGTSVLALDAETGRLRWSFQTTRHDLWDYDNASQPSLADVRGRKVLILPTKRAQIFMLDRATGEPVAQVVEKPVPTQGIVKGERVSPTQPYSIGMPDLGGPRLRESMMWGLSPIDQMLCRVMFRERRYDGDFTPPGLQANIVYPGYGGGMNWGSASIDRDRGLLLVNTIRQANSVRVVPRAEADKLGIKPMSSRSHANLALIVPQANTPYAADVRPFLSPIGTPCQQPPYGMMSAIDLASGKLVWQRPFGSAREAGPWGMKSRLPLPMGMPNIGGSVVTRGGVTFISATKDATFRAFETATGKLLWEVPLPAGGNATPLTYRGADGRQYLAIAAGGHYGTDGTRGDYVIAYRLP